MIAPEIAPIPAAIAIVLNLLIHGATPISNYFSLWCATFFGLFPVEVDAGDDPSLRLLPMRLKPCRGASFGFRDLFLGKDLQSLFAMDIGRGPNTDPGVDDYPFQQLDIVRFLSLIGRVPKGEE